MMEMGGRPPPSPHFQLNVFNFTHTKKRRKTQVTNTIMAIPSNNTHKKSPVPSPSPSRYVKAAQHKRTSVTPRLSYTDTEDAILRHLLKDHSVEVSAQIMGRTRYSLYNYCKRNNIPISPSPEKFITKQRLRELLGGITLVDVEWDIERAGNKITHRLVNKNKLPEIIEQHWPDIDADKVTDPEIRATVQEYQKGWMRLHELTKQLEGSLSHQGIRNIIKREAVKTIKTKKSVWIQTTPEEFLKLKKIQ